jgi:transposase
MKNQKEIEELKRALTDSALSKKEHIRVLAVLRRKEGWKRKEIQGFLGVSKNALEQWITAYNKEGIEGLKTEKRITSSTAKLKPEQIKQIEKFLRDETPDSLNISDQDYWDVETLRRLVKSRYGVEYKATSSYTRLFRRCGLSYQRVEFEDVRRDPRGVDEFKKRFEGKLKKGGSIVMSW